VLHNSSDDIDKIHQKNTSILFILMLLNNVSALNIYDEQVPSLLDGDM